MTVCMKNGDAEDNAGENVTKEPILHTAAMDYASYIVQDTNSNLVRDLVKQFLKKGECVVLSFTRGYHINQE